MGKDQRNCSQVSVRQYCAECSTEDPNCPLPKHRKPLCVVVQAALAWQKKSVAIPGWPALWNITSVLPLRQMSMCCVQLKQMTFSVQLFYHHPFCHLIQLQRVFPWTESAFTKHEKDGASDLCMSAALTQLCCVLALVSSAFPEEQGNTSEIGFHLFWIGIEQGNTLKRLSVIEGIMCKGIGFSYLDTEREQVCSLGQKFLQIHWQTVNDT